MYPSGMLPVVLHKNNVHTTMWPHRSPQNICQQRYTVHVYKLHLGAVIQSRVRCLYALANLSVRRANRTVSVAQWWRRNIWFVYVPYHVWPIGLLRLLLFAQASEHETVKSNFRAHRRMMNMQTLFWTSRLRMRVSHRLARSAGWRLTSFVK